MGSNWILGSGITLMQDGVSLPLKVHIHTLWVFLEPALFLNIQVATVGKRYQQVRISAAFLSVREGTCDNNYIEP